MPQKFKIDFQYYPEDEKSGSVYVTVNDVKQPVVNLPLKVLNNYHFQLEFQKLIISVFEKGLELNNEKA